jgi:hypothetical protein
MGKREEKFENRRIRLRQLIAERADGNQAAFGRLYGYERAQISQFLSANYNGGRSPGGNVIDELEERCGLPSGWFDRPADGALDWPFPELKKEEIDGLQLPERREVQAAMRAAIDAIKRRADAADLKSPHLTGTDAG